MLQVYKISKTPPPSRTIEVIVFNSYLSILGTPDDYAVEVASGAWFGSILFPCAVGLIVGGPIGLAAGATFGGIMAYEYEKHMWRKILEIVKRESKVQPTVDSIDYYHTGVA